MFTVIVIKTFNSILLHCSKSIRKFKLIRKSNVIYKSHFDVYKVILLMSEHLQIFCANFNVSCWIVYLEDWGVLIKPAFQSADVDVTLAFFMTRDIFCDFGPSLGLVTLIGKIGKTWKKELSNIFFANNSPVLCWQRPGHLLGKNVKFHETKYEKINYIFIYMYT